MNGPPLRDGVLRVRVSAEERALWTATLTELNRHATPGARLTLSEWVRALLNRASSATAPASVRTARSRVATK